MALESIHLEVINTQRDMCSCEHSRAEHGPYWAYPKVAHYTVNLGACRFLRKHGCGCKQFTWSHFATPKEEVNAQSNLEA